MSDTQIDSAYRNDIHAYNPVLAVEMGCNEHFFGFLA